MFLAFQVLLVFLLLFLTHFSYKYKESSKQHLFYLTITLAQNICLSRDFYGLTSESFY